MNSVDCARATSTIGSVLGTIATAVMPVLTVQFEMFGHIGQAVGAVLKSLAPAFASLGAITAAVFRSVQPIFNLVVDTLGGGLVTSLGGLAKAIDYVTPGIVVIANGITSIFSTIARWIRDLLEWVGILDAEKPGTVAGSSVGAAAKNATITSPANVIAEAQKAAFSLGSGARPEIEIGKSIDGRVKHLEDILLNKLPKALAAAIREGAVDTARGAGDTVSEAIGFAPGRFSSGLDEGKRLLNEGLDYLATARNAALDFFGRSPSPRGAVE